MKYWKLMKDKSILIFQIKCQVIEDLRLSPYNAVNSVGQELKKTSIFPRMGVAQTTYSQQGGIDG